jgi:two-component system chemotaxis family response regulator WspR
LLVDDQPFVAEAILRMLAGEPDLEFHYCADPSEALPRARDLGATVVLQDLVMPGIDGMTLVRFFRANTATSAIPVIVLSSKEEPLDKSAAFSVGASDYLVKLPDRIELIARIRAHSRSYLAHKQRDEAIVALRELSKKLEESNAALERLSQTDALTGIANRRRFDDALVAEWRRAYRADTSLAALLIDIDHFKQFNDACGHQQGDECLIKVAAALASGVRRPADLVARYGGEEFVALLPETPIDGALTVARNMADALAAVALPHPRSSVGPLTTVSIGAAAVRPRAAGKAEGLIEAADAALYQSKHAGRNRATAWVPPEADAVARP